MRFRVLLAPLLLSFCVGAVAQTPPASGMSRAQPKLPGTEEQGHFQFKDQKAASPVLGRLGQSAARLVAEKHHMGGKTVVNYGPATAACKAGAAKSECP